jgi:hypothetical protein
MHSKAYPPEGGQFQDDFAKNQHDCDKSGAIPPIDARSRTRFRRLLQEAR